jgi:DinB superfamily
MLSVTLKALADFPEQLAAYFSAIPKGFEHWRPQSWEGVPSEPYTAIEQICHVRDIEIEGYQVRFARTLTEDRPWLGSVDGDRLAEARAYAKAQGPEVLASIEQARKKTLSMLAGLTPDQWRRTAEFEGYGLVTLNGLVHFLCSHDQQHLAGLQWLLGKMTSPDRA